MSELHGDLFSRMLLHGPLGGYVFVTVQERGEDVMSRGFSVETTEGRKEAGVAAEVCSSQNGL